MYIVLASYWIKLILVCFQIRQTPKTKQNVEVTDFLIFMWKWNI